MFGFFIFAMSTVGGFTFLFLNLESNEKKNKYFVATNNRMVRFSENCFLKLNHGSECK